MPKKKIILTAILLILLFGGIFFVYQWWQVKEELVNQAHEREILLKQLSGIEKQSNFIECRKLNVKKDDPPFPVYLLNSFIPAKFGPAGIEKEERHMWNFIIIDPDGYGSGMGMTYESEARAGMEEQIPIPNEDTKSMDRVIVMTPQKIGDYLIAVFPQRYILPADTYGLQLGDHFILAKDVPFSPNLLDRIYILRQTETSIIPIVPANVGCKF